MTTHIGKYEIIEELGRGGFATVYKARDTALERIVALKVLHPYWTSDPNFAARFRQEARTAANLRHANIVTVYEAGEVEGQLYIVMEYLPGRTLHDLLEARGALSLEDALPILEQIAAALDCAHGQGVIHRDIKPLNVMVEDTPSGPHVTLMDFGLVKAMEGSSALTSQGTLLGSPEYMAPEQAEVDDSRAIDWRTDLYALGVVAYEMLVGRPPFIGNDLATLNAHVHIVPPDPRRFIPDLPEQVVAVLSTMLAKAPADRFPKANAFVARLREAQDAASTSRARLVRQWQPLPGWLKSVGIVLAAVIVLVTMFGPPLWEALFGAQMPTPGPTPDFSIPSCDTAGATWIRPTDGMTMVCVPGGTFLMGSGIGDEDEKPVHQVALSAFWIDQTEVTNAQYGNCVAGGACVVSAYVDDAWLNGDQQPVVGVDWHNAMAYCIWAGATLPTEAQWEYAARGGERYIYPWGNDWREKVANCKELVCRDGFEYTAPVDSFPEGKSWVGALDMAGNVWEWTADWYAGYPSTSQINPYGPAGGRSIVVRGGSWGYDENGVRSTDRLGSVPTNYYNDLGFRCVMVRAQD